MTATALTTVLLLLSGCAVANESPLLMPAPGSPLAVAGGSLVAGDVNGDRHQDLLVISGQERGTHVLMGDGRGGFAKTEFIALPQGGGEPKLGDVNSDGKLDLAVISHDSYDVTILAGDGKGGFSPLPGSPFRVKKGEHPHTHGLALGDLDGDGDLDLVTANNEDGDVSVMLGDGRGGFTPAPGSPFACGPGPYPIALADVTGDGKLDVLVPNSGPQNVTLTVLAGNGKGGFAPARGSPVKTSGSPYFVAAGDLNGDGKIDAVIAHGNDADTGSVLLNDGKGQLTPSPLNLGSRAWEMAIKDMNGDGKTDVVAAAGDVLRLFLGDGRGGLRPAAGSPFTTGKGTWRLAIADFNEDGRPDVAATCLEAGHVVILLGR